MKNIKREIFKIISIGNKEDRFSRFFDIFIVVCIFLNLAALIMGTYDELEPIKPLIDVVEWVTIVIFTIEYILRLGTAEMLYPDKTKFKAVLTFVFSFYGIIDFLSFFPFYLPFVFPIGAVAFRFFRVIRIFRLFRVNSQYDAFNVIVEVLNEKKKQLLSSIVMISIMMVSASLCMYSLEHDAQPEQFKNAFSGIWWSMSTLLTVGYGDIYPITTWGKVFAILIAFLGVGMVAIPTGIISAGFVEQYTKIKRLMEVSEEREVGFIAIAISKGHRWIGSKIKELPFEPDMFVASIIRNGKHFIPGNEEIVCVGDVLIIADGDYDDAPDIHLRELVIKSENEWVDCKVADLDISRKDAIVAIKRKKRKIIPGDDTIIRKGDIVFMYMGSKE